MSKLMLGRIDDAPAGLRWLTGLPGSGDIKMTHKAHPIVKRSDVLARRLPVLQERIEDQFEQVSVYCTSVDTHVLCSYS